MNADKFSPFANDDAALNIGDLSIENSTSEILVHGSVALSFDKASQERAERLSVLFNDIFNRIGQSLAVGVVVPAQVGDITTEEIDNPFA